MKKLVFAFVLALNEFGEQYARYTEITPAFVPRLRGRRQDVESH